MTQVNAQIAHVFAGMFLGEEIATGSNVGNYIQSEIFIIDDDALHYFVDDGEYFAIEHHLGIGPNAAAMQETGAEQHV